MSRTSAEQQALAQAADWYLRLHLEEGSAADHQSWQQWLASSPLHASAWQRVERMQSLMARAPSHARRTLQSSKGAGRRRLATLAGALLVSGLAWQGVARWQRPRDPLWLATGPGERRSWTLPDGTRVLLGALSRVGVDFSGRHRELQLQQGFLQVSTGHDPAYADHPLRVLARDGVVRPLGTQFTLVQQQDQTALAVQEDEVELLVPGRAPLRLAAGQRVQFSAQGLGAVEAASAADSAWARGQLVVMHMRLADFVQALSRHSGRTIACDAAVAELRVSGSYLVDDPERSLRSVAAVLPVRVAPTASGFQLHARR